ncbi:hypothetical protein [Thermofilum sp.]
MPREGGGDGFCSRALGCVPAGVELLPTSGVIVECRGWSIRG